MDKFSLYDFLAIILPGIVFITGIRIALSAMDLALAAGVPTGWESVTVYALISGAFLYALSFIIHRSYPRLFGLYRHVTDLYEEMKHLHPFMNEVLNNETERCNLGRVYLSQEEYKQTKEKDKIRQAQSDFYDRMWYRLDYEGKLGNAKSFQCYYFFFRHSFWGLMLISLLLLGCKLIGYIPACNFAPISWSTYCPVALSILLLAALFVLLAQWFRRKMVEKMYWAFYTSLTEQERQRSI